MNIGNVDDSPHEDEEENDSEEEEEEEEQEDEGVNDEELEQAMNQELSIVAVPPKLVPREENLLEASSSPAFHILDTVSILCCLFEGSLMNSANCMLAALLHLVLIS